MWNVKCEISGQVQTTKAVVQSCSVKKVFLEILQKSQENICTRVSFLIKLQVSDLPCSSVKKDTLTQSLSCEFCEISKNSFFYKRPLVGASENIMQQCKQVLNSLANQLQALNSQNTWVFFHLTSDKFFFTKSKNATAKKLCDGEVALKVPRKLICYSWFCNVVGCKTQISVVLGCSPGRFTSKV